MTYKFITDHSVKNDNQTIRRVLCSTPTLHISDFDHNVDKLIIHIQENVHILILSEKTDRSIAANLFCILKVALCGKFHS